MLTKTLVALTSAAVAVAQAPNTIAERYPDLRTASSNSTFFIVPMDIDVVSEVVGPYDLLPVPADDTSIFPNSFPEGKHPVIVTETLQFDIRMGPLFIQALGSGAISVPFVDRLGDGQSAIQIPVANYIAGYDGNSLGSLVPAIASTLLFGYTLQFGSKTPDDAAYTRLTADEFTTQIRQSIVPNPVSGPGVAPPVIDMTFSSAGDDAAYSIDTFSALLNQPQTLNTGLCQRNLYFFNESFAEPTLRDGTVTLYDGVLSPKNEKLAGTYEGQTGLSVAAQNVGMSPETCESAIENSA